MKPELRSTATSFHVVLEQYLAQQVLSAPLTQTNRQHFIKWIAMLLGVMWGLPWIWSCLTAATVFPQSVSGFLGGLFAVGIVMTVGADGWWIMRETHEYLAKKSSIEKAWQRIQQGNMGTRYLKRLTAFLFASCSCIAPVYASIHFTTGLAQYLSFITLIVYYGYGLVGYTQLIDRISVWWQDKQSHPDLVRTRNRLSQVLDELAEDASANLTTAAQWMTCLENSNHNEKIIKPTALKTLTSKQKILQKIIVCLIPPLASLVSLFLIRDFLYMHIWNNTIFAIIVAVIAELPGFVINTLATYKVTGYLLEMLNEPRKNVSLKNGVPMLLSLLAPTAAVYITWTTLTAHQVSHAVVLAAMIAIGLARMVFSWFTLTHVTEALFASDHVDILRQSRIRKFAQQFNQLNPVYFRSWPENVPAAASVVMTQPNIS